jgi:hypothetical protein
VTFKNTFSIPEEDSCHQIRIITTKTGVDSRGNDVQVRGRSPDNCCIGSLLDKNGCRQFPPVYILPEFSNVQQTATVAVGSR